MRRPLMTGLKKIKTCHLERERSGKRNAPLVVSSGHFETDFVWGILR